MGGRAGLTLFVLLVVGGGLTVGFLTAPGVWYQSLVKPSFNPPNWIFAPTWTVLYVLIAVAGWRVWRRDPSAGAMKLWWMQLALNFMWSPVFFSLHMIGVAAFIILLLLATVLGFIVALWRDDRLTACLFLPYAAWVAFAFLLNVSIWALN